MHVSARNHMKLRSLALAALALLAHWTIVGCSSSSKPVGAAATGGTGGTSPNPDGSTDETVGSFTVSLVSAAVEGGINPPYADVAGFVKDGPTPELPFETALAAPSDATPGCLVYNVSSPVCTGNCGATSTNAACAAAVNGGNPCICVADETCQFPPTKKNVGAVTVYGVAATSGATQFDLMNLNNSYLLGPDTTLEYPPFAEGDPIKISAAGGDYEHFEISAKGIAPLTLANEPYHLARDPSSNDPNRYLPLTIKWTPADLDAGITTKVEVELNIARHAGSIALLICEVEDNGELVISSGLISQLLTVGTIGGNPELNVTRSLTESTAITPGKVELVVQSNIERFITMEGYTSCTVNTDCPTGQVCNGAKWLCVAP
jgi:hypothetical protein